MGIRHDAAACPKASFAIGEYQGTDSDVVIHVAIEADNEPPNRNAARSVWALLRVSIVEVLPLLCPQCGGEMRIIAFIT